MARNTNKTARFHEIIAVGPGLPEPTGVKYRIGSHFADCGSQWLQPCIPPGLEKYME